MGNALEQWRASIGGWTRGNAPTASNSCKESCTSPWFQLLVVVFLLVIGGIEMNPGPNQAAQSKHKKTTGAADMSGELFEVKMSTLYFLRGINSQRDFRIASNMAAAGSYDDIVFTLGHQSAFMQLKHRQKKDAKIYMSQLLNVKGDFSLLRYCKSYFDIKRQWQQDEDLQNCGSFKDSLFILFTNASLVGNVGSSVGSSGMLGLVTTGGKLTQFTENDHKHIYDVFGSLNSYKRLLSEAVGGEQVKDSPELLHLVRILLNHKAKCLPEKKDLVKLLTELESLGEMSDYTEFLSQFRFCTEQTGESDLDDLIGSELKSLWGNCACFIELKTGVENWWKKSNMYLTVKAKFFQDIVQKIAANITKNISEINVMFVDSECELIRQKFTGNNRNLYIQTKCTKLSCVKVLQSLKTNLLVDVSTLQTHLSEVLAVCRLGECDVLVVEGAISDPNILQKLKNMPDSKCVVVNSGTSDHMQLYQKFKFISFNDTFCLSQLDSNSQREVLEREVMFQGLPVKLNSLADVSFFQNAITADVVIQLHHTFQVGCKFDDLDPCYLPRIFLRREYVSERIFRELHIILAVTGLSEDRLAQLVPNGEKIRKFHANNITEDKNCRYFLIEGEAEFTAICRVNDNVHWIQNSAGGLMWKKSEGDMSPVIKHLEHTCVKYVGAEEILASPQKVVVVVAEPGMGKSTEMCNINHVIKHKDPSTWVINVDLNKYTNLLSQRRLNAVEFLETAAILNTDFEKRLFEHQLKSNGNVVILLDGFDEVSTNYSEQVFDLMTKICEHKFEKKIITSRPVVKKELQQKLSTIAFSFRPFTSGNKKTFLLKHWRKNSINSPDLSKFVSLFLKFMDTCLSEQLNEFAGIPLQCKMLGEVFQDEASHFCQTGEDRLPRSLDVLQLYDKFIDKKWQVYCKKLYREVSNAMLEQEIQTQKLQYQQSYMNCAMKSYFEDNYISTLCCSNDIQKENNAFIIKFNSVQDKTGIVSHVVNGKAVFIHRTFTEYFVAMWFFKNINLNLKSIKKFYLDNNYEIVRKFLDRMLTRERKLHTIVLNKDTPKLRTLLSKENCDVNEKDEGGRTALHLATMNYFNNKDKFNDSVMETLLEHGADVNCKDEILHFRPLKLAEKIRAWFVVDKLLLDKQADSRDLVWIKENINTKRLQVARSKVRFKFVGYVPMPRFNVKHHMSHLLLHVMYTALSEGYVNLIEFVLKCGVSVQHYVTDGYKTTMLHVAAKYNQLRLVQFLITQGADVDISGGEYNITPLMQAVESGHMELVKLLINHGASVNIRYGYGHTALSIAAIKGKDEIVELLLEKGADVNISGGNYNRTPLIEAAACGNVKLVKLLINHGASVNRIDELRHTALLLASSQGEHEIAELLLEKGADVEISGGKYNRTPLMEAVECGHLEIVTLLINHGASVTRNVYGNTALSLAARKGKHEILKLLLETGVDADTCDGILLDRTSLMEAANCGHVEVVKLLINHGASVNTRDNDGYTALALAARKGKREIVELLLEKGADVDISYGELNITPLMQAAECGHVEIVKLLLNHGAPLNARNKFVQTALSLAASEGKHVIVELLLEKGAVVDVIYDDGLYNRTPLMRAAECGHVEVVKLLINHGASVNTRNKHGETALSLAVRNRKHEILDLFLQNTTYNTSDTSALICRGGCGDMQALQYLINNNIINSKDQQGNTAFSVAVLLGKHKIVKLLLEKGADVDMIYYDGDWDKRTALMRAAECGHVEVVKLLINHGASVNTRDTFGKTALSLAASEKKHEIVKLLLEKGADVDISHDEYNGSVLMEASERGHVQVVKILTDHGVPVNTRDTYGNTALSIAANEGNHKILKLLLEKRAHFDISSGTYNRTPLMEAAELGHVEVVKLLINHGASVNTRDKYGNTALSLAVSKRKHEIVELLLENGADVDVFDGVYNRTPLMWAAESGDRQLLKLLINHGASLNKRNKDGHTAMSLAVREGEHEIVELLLEIGAIK